MKKSTVIVIAGCFLLMLSSLDVNAQQMSNMSTGLSKIVADTSFVRGLEVTLEPGQKTDLHSHPAYFFYAITDGKITAHFQDGKDETFELKAGDSMASGPEGPHVTENTGKSTVKFLVVELKEHPYVKPK